MSSTQIPLIIKWGKETVEMQMMPDAGVKGLKTELEEKTGVPSDRMKLMSKTKGLWKGVLKDDVDLASFDWNAAVGNGKDKSVQLLLMGSATQLKGPKIKTVFLEDLPPEEIAKVQEPSGLVNLGNTCYLNSVMQCLRVVPELRKGLEQYRPGTNSSSASSGVLIESMKLTYNKLDRQADAYQPTMLVQAVKMAFPQFAQTGPGGVPQQQDAEECFSNLMTTLAAQLRGQENIRAALQAPDITEKELMGATNLIDALFGMKMKETLTCDEFASTATDAKKDGDNGDKMETSIDGPVEPPVVTYDLHRKLVCNIQGGSDGSSSNVNISHIAEGIKLSLEGKIEKQSDVLGRNAVWTRTQRIARLPPVLAVQFGRFYWKATPDSQDHQGVKCKVMKPVTFQSTLDVYDFCTPEIQKVLQVGRNKARQAEEDRIAKKLKGELEEKSKNGDGDDKMETDEESKKKAEEETAEGDVDEEDDPDMKAALALSMEEEQPPVGPGLPNEFQGVYELFAVVTHKGRDADGGHYMAWVKAQNTSGKEAEKIADTDEVNEDWFVFDDDEVSPCKTEDVLKLKGGGDWHMSYLNFYRAKK